MTLKESEQVLPLSCHVHHDFPVSEHALRQVKGVLYCERLRPAGPSLRQLAVSGRSMCPGPGTGAELWRGLRPGAGRRRRSVRLAEGLQEAQGRSEVFTEGHGSWQARVEKQVVVETTP